MAIVHEVHEVKGTVDNYWKMKLCFSDNPKRSTLKNLLKPYIGKTCRYNTWAGEMKSPPSTHVFFFFGGIAAGFKSIHRPWNQFWDSQLIIIFCYIDFIAWKLGFFCGFYCWLSLVSCRFPSSTFSHWTQTTFGVCSAGGCSESVSLADSWDSSACTSLASGSSYLSPRLIGRSGLPSSLKANTT